MSSEKEKTPPVWPSRNTIHERALGALLGQLVGDALGFRYFPMIN